MRSMKAVGYVRVSTEEQAREGVSLGAQRAKLEAWALSQDAELVAIFEDAGISGATVGHRGGLQAAVAEACRRKAALVVYSLSRLSRSTRDTLELAERLDRAGADLVSLSEKIDTTSAAGKMVFRLLAVLAEFERDQLAERTKGAMAHLQAKGRRVSLHAPLGSRFEGDRVVQDLEEAQVLDRLRAWREEGLTIREIASKANAEGLPARGAKWHRTSVHRILSRAKASREIR